MEVDCTEPRCIFSSSPLTISKVFLSLDVSETSGFLDQVDYSLYCFDSDSACSGHSFPSAFALSVHCTLEPHAPSQSMTEYFTAHGRWENGEIAHFSPGPAVVRRFPGRSVPVSLRTKIRAESSSNGSSGQPRTAHDELRPALREASPNLALRRPWGQLLRQRQNDPVRVGGTY